MEVPWETMSRIESKIRVAILVGQTGYGGAERQLLYFVQNGNKERYEYHIIVLNSRKPYTHDDALREQGAVVWQVPPNIQNLLRRLWYLTRLLQQIKPQVALSWSFYANPYVGVAGRLSRVPVRLGSLRNDPDEEAMIKMAPLFRWLGYRSVQSIIVNSRRVGEKLIARGFSPAYVKVVLNGSVFVEPEAKDVDLSPLGIRKEHRVIANCGNLQKRKNQRMFIDGFGYLVRRFPDVHGLIIGRELPGEPHMRSYLETHINERGLSDHVHLIGFRDDVPQLMHRFDVFCLTSYSEGMPNVVLEAMAAARPVVVTPVGDLPNIIEDGRNGFLVDIDDAEHMARIVQRLLEAPELAAQIGAAAQETVRTRFGCARMAREMEAIFAEALQQAGFSPNEKTP